MIICQVDEKASWQNAYLVKWQFYKMAKWWNDELMKTQVDEMASWQDSKPVKQQVNKALNWWNVKLMKHPSAH
jgi:hypothetical protein